MLLKSSRGSVPSWHEIPDDVWAWLDHQRYIFAAVRARPDIRNPFSYLFFDITDPPDRLCLSADADERDIRLLFNEIDSMQRRGYYIGGHVAYELGYILLSLQDLKPEFSGDLARFGCYRQCLVFDHRTNEASIRDVRGKDRPFRAKPTGKKGPPQATCDISTIEWQKQFSIDRAAYRRSIGTIRNYLYEGHCYQINLTGFASGRVRGKAVPIFRALLRWQKCSCAMLQTWDEGSLLSLSPELFFERIGTRIAVRPMKGTYRRGHTWADDMRRIGHFRRDIKTRAENGMIADLLRNDLGKIARFGSVRVTDLFRVERYPTLLQMTTEIDADIPAETSSYRIFRALFPSGSVTGAPKRRAVEIIRSLENQARGPYTGAMGYMLPENRALFNISIRTIALHRRTARLGIGSGIVVDSDPKSEYAECLLKADFARNRPALPDYVFTTMLFRRRLVFFRSHIRRLLTSAAFFLFPYNRNELRKMLHRLYRDLRGRHCRVHLRIRSDGRISAECSESIPANRVIRVTISDIRTDPENPFLYHKTNRRELYEREWNRAVQSGYDEILFCNRNGYFTEGAVSNVFFLIDDQWVTPPVSDGLLPGILRSRLLRRRHWAERSVHITELPYIRRTLFVNSVRGIREAIMDPGTAFLGSRHFQRGS